MSYVVSQLGNINMPLKRKDVLRYPTPSSGFGVVRKLAVNKMKQKIATTPSITPPSKRGDVFFITIWPPNFGRRTQTTFPKRCRLFNIYMLDDWNEWLWINGKEGVWRLRRRRRRWLQNLVFVSNENNSEASANSEATEHDSQVWKRLELRFVPFYYLSTNAENVK